MIKETNMLICFLAVTKIRKSTPVSYLRTAASNRWLAELITVAKTVAAQRAADT